jgi:hypothetical protein
MIFLVTLGSAIIILIEKSVEINSKLRQICMKQLFILKSEGICSLDMHACVYVQLCIYEYACVCLAQDMSTLIKWE